MLRKVTQAGGNAVLERTLSSSNSTASQRLSLKAYSTWLNAHHLPRLIHEPSLSQTNRRFLSTYQPSQRTADKGTEAPLLPRFIRREQLQPNAARGKDRPPRHAFKQKEHATFTSPRAISRFRSRHYDPSEEKPKGELRPLEPHVLSSRLKKLCDAGKLDDSVCMLKNAPLDAQNTPVWNTLIWEALKAKRFQLGYQLFVDMKRRGFSPTTRTFQTFFNGLARIDHWSTHPKQLLNARSLYEAFQRHISSLKRHDPNDAELSIDPLAGYIRILGNAGQYQEVFDVYYAMDQEGPLAPNQFIFTAMFQAIAAAKSDTTEGSVKVAADARMIWSQLIKASKKSPGFTPDSHTVVAALGALAGGNQPDHELAFRLIAQYFGLEADKTVSKPGMFPLKPESLAVILRLCNQSENYTLATKFFQQVKRRPEVGGVSILDRAHMEETLRAELALRETGLGYHAVETLEWMLRQEITGPNGPKIRPSLSTYNLVMQACWRSGDWNGATRTFDLMTGYHAHDFMDGSVAPIPRFDKRGEGRNLPATAEFMSSMLRAALITRNRADTRQVLRIVDHLGFEKLLRTGTERKMTSKSVKQKAFFGAKFASAVIDAANTVLEEQGKYARPEEAKKWKALAQEAKAQLDDLSIVPAHTKEAHGTRHRR